jgi:hypothetical protein
MDGESFDRLSVIVHRLGDGATRRGALRTLLGGSLAAASGLLAEGTEAKKHRRRRGCKGFGGGCNSNRDCCNGRCRNGFCFPGNGGGGGGGGGNRCNRGCQNGWQCCRQNGVDVCVPNNLPTCCGGNGFNSGFHCCGGNGGACPSGWDCCGGFNQCCSAGWKCCGNGRCCPDGWFCRNDGTCQANQDARSSGASGEVVPSREPVTIDDNDWIDLSKA